MSIFSRIKDSIFGKKEEAPAPAPSPSPVDMANEAIAVAAAAAPAPLSEVDVEASLDAMPGADKLNWRSSIVDLMKLVGIDASYDNRKELAHELGDADYSGSAEENITLHKQVMKALSDNGGKVPASMLD
ncbi:DUF3597 domain-containing protein [Novosphingobium sp.]|jgi:hypothetical protein|uniref:DUF3597 domain-containing protein n=1 Tax=Novosphingobium sp. TaxID=1874826 RepID=UPI00286DC910|nr:DUF3597 domain-containing protein [Novosphingobium sp.]